MWINVWRKHFKAIWFLDVCKTFFGKTQNILCFQLQIGRNKILKKFSTGLIAGGFCTALENYKKLQTFFEALVTHRGWYLKADWQNKLISNKVESSSGITSPTKYDLQECLKYRFQTSGRSAVTTFTFERFVPSNSNGLNLLPYFLNDHEILI